MESPAFEILLIGFAFDDEEPTVLDLTAMTEQEKESWKTQFKQWLADPEIREERIVARDSITPEQARNRMDSQLPEDFFRTHSDYIITNNGTIDSLTEISKEVSDKIKDYYKTKLDPAQRISG